jgi:antitoxin ParD1/3/4
MAELGAESRPVKEIATFSVSVMPQPYCKNHIQSRALSGLVFDKDCQCLYGSAMHISLTPELENAVKAKVQSGLYNNASEVVREALRQSLARERENAWLAREAAIGFAQLEAGQTVMVDSKERFMALVREEP